MATITSAQSGNFSDTATWVGGIVPTVGDIAVAATGHVVAVDVDTTVDKVTQAGTGKFTLGNGRTLTAEVEANAGTFTSGGTVEVTATSGNTAYIVGNVTGVSSTAVNVCGVNVTGAGTLDLTGNVTGSAGNASSEVNGHAGVYTNVTCTITINGDVSGGSGQHKRGVQAGASSDATIILTSTTIQGGATTNAYGVFAQGASATISVTATTVAGGGNGAAGIVHQGASGSVTVAATTIRGGGDFAAYGIFHSGVSGTINATAETIDGRDFRNNPYAVFHTGNSGVTTLTATTVSGGSTAPSVVINGISGVLTVTATNITNRGIYAILHNGTSGVVNVTGSITATATTTGIGVYAIGASSTVNVIGSATAANTLAHGVRCDATVNGVIFQGDLTDSSQGVVAVYSRLFRMSATNSGVTTYTNTIGYPTGTPVSRVSPDNVTGMASQTDVRLNTIYGYNNELTGSMAVPVAQSVAYGVPVDATTGTAEFDLGRVAQIIGLQVAAGKST